MSQTAETVSRETAAHSKAPLRFVTAASLFDGHDAAINIMRRLIQGQGAEVIHLGHNRSVEDVVRAALQEDADAIALSSYQGGHVEYFKYMLDLLRANGGADIKVFGGGGGVIVTAAIKELEAYGIARIYSPEDGQRMGLQGMINDMLARCDFDLAQHAPKELKPGEVLMLENTRFHKGEEKNDLELAKKMAALAEVFAVLFQLPLLGFDIPIELNAHAPILRLAALTG